MFGVLAEKLIAYRKSAMAFFVLIILLAAAGMAHLKVDFSFQAVIGSDDPAYENLERFLKAWDGDEKLLFVLAEVEEGSLLQAKRLSQMTALGEALQQVDVVKATMTLADFPMPQEDTGEIRFESIEEAAPPQGGPAQAWKVWRTRVLNEPNIVPSILSKDGRTSMLWVELDFDTDDLLAFIPALEKIREVVAQYESKEGIHFEMAGIPAVRADVSATMQRDMKTYTSLSFILMFFILCLLFRTKHGVVIPMIGAMIPTLMLLGVMGWIGEPAGLVSQVYPILIPAIAVADVIHVISRFDAEALKVLKPGQTVLTPQQNKQAICAAMRHVGGACFFTSFTTCIGFLALLVADMKVMQNFGLYASLGIALAFTTMVIAVPLMLSFVSRVPLKSVEEGRVKGLDRFLVWTGKTTAERPTLWLLVGVAVALTSLFIAKDVRVDNRLSDVLPLDHETNRAGRVIDEKLGGLLALHIDVSGEPGDMIKAKTLNAFQKIEDWAKEFPEFITTQSPATLARELNRSLTGNHRVPQTDDLSAQLFFLAQGQELMNRLLYEDHDRARMLLTVRDDGAAALEARTDALQKVIQETFEPLGLQAALTGVPFVAYKGFSKIGVEMLKSISMALFLIALVIGFLFRSLRICIISLVPNVLPLLVTLAVMVLAGWTIEATSAMVFTIGLGLAVDDSIHMLARYYEEQRLGGSSHEIMQRSILKTGRALLITTFVLVLGFGINVFSDFPFLKIFGTLGSVAIGTALLCDFFFLPPLLNRWGTARYKKSRTKAA
jgi:uncharacterized protein